MTSIKTLLAAAATLALVSSPALAQTAAKPASTAAKPKAASTAASTAAKPALPPLTLGAAIPVVCLLIL